MIRFPWQKKKPSIPAAPWERLLTYQCAVMQGIGSRQQQEDACVLVNAEDVTRIGREGLLAAVADGMGGMQGGAQASSLGISVLTADFPLLDRPRPVLVNSWEG